MESIPSTPDPTDHEGASTYEGWDPTPDPSGELDIPSADGSGVETNASPGIAFVPSETPADAGPDTGGDAARSSLATLDAREDEVVSLRERLAFYESFDTLIRDNIDRAGVLMREAATRQGDAEVKLRTSSREFERRQIEERSGYRKVFATLLDDVSTLQQQVERMARQVSDALDDLEVQLPAVGELSAIERGQALGMSGFASSHLEPAELPSGASSTAWVAHDDMIHPSPATAASSMANPSPRMMVDQEDPATVQADPALVDPEMLVEVLLEGTDADPAVAGEEAGYAVEVVVLTDLPIGLELDLDEPITGAEIGLVDEAYVEEAVGGSHATSFADDLLDERLTETTRPDGFYVEHSLDIDDLDLAATPLRQSAPAEVGEVAPGLDVSTPELVGLAASDPALDEQPADEGFVSTPPDVAEMAASPFASDVEPTPGVEQDTIVLVHGVPRATTALSLKRYLEGLSVVTAVEPREYAEGVLRLQVTGDRPIRVADLSAWPDGSGLQEVMVRDDLVEVRLPG